MPGWAGSRGWCGRQHMDKARFACQSHYSSGSLWDRLSGSSQSCLLNRSSNTDLPKICALAFPGCCEDDLFAKTNGWRFLKKRCKVKKWNAIKVSFSICTSIRQLFEYFILSSDMPSSSFTNLLPNFKTPLTIGQYLQQKAHSRCTMLCFAKHNHSNNHLQL